MRQRILDMAQNIKPFGVEVAEVYTINPLSIKLLRDPSLPPIKESVIDVCQHLTDYAIEIDIDANNISSTANDPGDPGPPPTHFHTHGLAPFNIQRGNIKLYNHLEPKELVWVISYEENQKFLIVDRV